MCTSLSSGQAFTSPSWIRGHSSSKCYSTLLKESEMLDIPVEELNKKPTQNVLTFEWRKHNSEPYSNPSYQTCSIVSTYPLSPVYVSLLVIMRSQCRIFIHHQGDAYHLNGVIWRGGWFSANRSKCLNNRWRFTLDVPRCQL
uniref:Uncharacterized protein n=1 Tax=Solanum lycopersicum TaxID=4081 RepID=A0A3Q7HTC6_SOLLC